MFMCIAFHTRTASKKKKLAPFSGICCRLTESKLLETGTKKILIHIKVEAKNGRP